MLALTASYPLRQEASYSYWNIIFLGHQLQEFRSLKQPSRTITTTRSSQIHLKSNVPRGSATNGATSFAGSSAEFRPGVLCGQDSSAVPRLARASSEPQRGRHQKTPRPTPPRRLSGLGLKRPLSLLLTGDLTVILSKNKSQDWTLGNKPRTILYACQLSILWLWKHTDTSSDQLGSDSDLRCMPVTAASPAQQLLLLAQRCRPQQEAAVFSLSDLARLLLHILGPLTLLSCIWFSGASSETRNQEYPRAHI